MPKGKKKRSLGKGDKAANASFMISQSSAALRLSNQGGDSLAGYIFLCSSQTKPECFRYRVFGLPANAMDVVAKIKTSTRLFLYDFNVKLLYGVYAAVSDGQLKLEPAAFGGKFPAQVRFEIVSDCIPLPESALKHAIKNNYEGHSKFRQEISQEQADLLVSLFRPIVVSQPRFATYQSSIATSLPLRIKEPSIQHHHQRSAPPYIPYSRPVKRLAAYDDTYYPVEANPTVLNHGSYLRYPHSLYESGERSVPEYMNSGGDSVAQPQHAYSDIGNKIPSSGSIASDAAYWTSIAASSGASAYPPPIHHQHQDAAVGNGIMLGNNVAIAHPQLQQLQEQVRAMQQLLQQAAPGLLQMRQQQLPQVQEQHQQQQVMQVSQAQWQQLQEHAIAIQQPQAISTISSDLNSNLAPPVTTYWTEAAGSVDSYGARPSYYMGEAYSSGGLRADEYGVPRVLPLTKAPAAAYWSPATYVEPKI